MTQIVGINIRAETEKAQHHVCWTCHGRVETASFFCGHCGLVQPVRAVDHFARLGLERRLDVDLAELEQVFVRLKRPLDPNYFMIRSTTERAYAARQLEVLVEAYDALRDPIARGRYWLTLHTNDFAMAKSDNPKLKELQASCVGCIDANELDRLARETSQEMQDGMMRLLSSLRQQNWELANAALIELDGMEDVLAQTRAKRQALIQENREQSA